MWLYCRARFPFFFRDGQLRLPRAGSCQDPANKASETVVRLTFPLFYEIGTSLGTRKVYSYTSQSLLNTQEEWYPGWVKPLPNKGHPLTQSILVKLALANLVTKASHFLEKR